MDENGKPVEIRFRERGESEKLIEEFMLQANEAVAEYMCKRELPTVYRVHENPDPDKLRVFASFARPFGYRIDPSSRRIRRSSRPCCAAQRTTRSSACCRRFCCARWRVPATRMSALAITA